MQKAQIIAILERSGFETESAYEVYAVHFKNAHHTKHDALLAEWARPEAITAVTGEGASGTVQKEITMTETTNTHIDAAFVAEKSNQPEVRVHLDFHYREYEYEGNDGVIRRGLSDDSTVRIYLEGHADGKEMQLPYRDKVQAALTAVTDYVHFDNNCAADWTCWIYKGLQSNMSMEELMEVDSYIAKEALIFHNFNDDRLPFASSEGKPIAWLNTTISGRSWKAENVRFTGNVKQNTRMMNKHYMMNYIMSGRVLVGSLKTLGAGYLDAVLSTYAADDKDAAYNAYAKRKSESGQVEDSVDRGKKIVAKEKAQLREIENGNTNDGTDVVIIESVLVRINGGEVQEVKFDDLERLSYRVFTAAGAERAPLTYTGSALQQNRLKDIGKRGDTLVATK